MSLKLDVTKRDDEEVWVCGVCGSENPTEADANQCFLNCKLMAVQIQNHETLGSVLKQSVTFLMTYLQQKLFQ